MEESRPTAFNFSKKKEDVFCSLALYDFYRWIISATLTVLLYMPLEAYTGEDVEDYADIVCEEIEYILDCSLSEGYKFNIEIKVNTDLTFEIIVTNWTDTSGKFSEICAELEPDSAMLLEIADLMSSFSACLKTIIERKMKLLGVTIEDVAFLCCKHQRSIKVSELIEYCLKNFDSCNKN